MKKALFSAFLLSAVAVNAQIGKVGVNTNNPKATLDIQPSPANALSTATTNEGVLIPKLSKTRVANIATPEDATMIYVSDVTYTGTNPAVADITSKGFYYYDADPVMPINSKWKKLNVNAGGTNLYNTDGTLTDNRTVNMNGKNLSFTGTGNVGIGKAATADHRLEVAGSIKAEGYLRSSVNDPVGGYLSLINPQKTGATAASDWTIFNMTGAYSNSLQFWRYFNNYANGGPVMTLGDNGFVGIGLPTNVSPAHRVHIKDGHFYAEEGALYSQYSNNEGGRVVLRNPNKTGGIANEWVLFNMTSAYGTPSLQFWRYFQSGGGGMVMTLADDGNVGIGTSSPGLRLHVVSPNEHKIRLQQEGSADFTDLLKRGNGTFNVYNNTGGIWQHGLAITNSGNVGIGTESPAHKFVVEGNAAINNGNFYQYGGGTMYTGSGGIWANGLIYASQDISTTYVRVRKSGNGSNICSATEVGWIRYDDVNGKFQGCARNQWGGYIWHNFN